MTLFDPEPQIAPDATKVPARWTAGRPYVRLVVRGRPITQGDLNYSPRSRRLYHANHKELDPWRNHIAAVGIRAMCPTGPDGRAAIRTPLDGPLAARLVFSLLRPPSVKDRRDPSVPPDLDKLARAVLDALKIGDGTKERRGRIWADDARVVDLSLAKVYVGLDPEALLFEGVTIHVWELST